MTSEAWPGLVLGRPVLPTLRPDAAAVAAISSAIDRHDRRVLLLGVSPELYGLGRDLTAIDADPDQIAIAWAGDRKDRRAVLDDWRTMAPCWGPFTAACGDGTLNALDWPFGLRAMFRQLARLLAPQARVAIRCWLTPDRPETLHEVRAAGLAGRVSNLGELVLRVAMARPDPGDGPRLDAAAILAAFDRAFPDRAELARAMRCDPAELDGIDAARDSAAIRSYPTRQELLNLLPPAFASPRFVPAARHPLAERCAVFIADFCP